MIGIDFGTTNSCVAIRDAFGEVRAVPVSTGRAPFNTVLRSAILDPEGERSWVGHEAIERAESAPDLRFLEYFKPILDEHQLRERVTRRLTVGSVFDPMSQATVDDVRWVSVWIGREELFSRRELIRGSSLLLSRMLNCAIAEGGDPGEIWLGMPVSFSSCARKRMLAALHLTRDDAGQPIFDGYADILRRVRFVLEPVAVAAGPDLSGIDADAGRPEVALVFDHGGGTLDLSVIEYEYDERFGRSVPTRELGAGGSRDVAGRSIDQAFKAALMRRNDFQQAQSNFDDRDAYLVNGLIELCKINLSTEMTVPAIPGVDVARSEFEAAVVPVLDRIEALVRDVMRSCELDFERVDRVVLTGGSSLIPAVQSRVRSLFTHLDEYRFLSYDPRSRDDCEHAMTDVARGLVAFAEDVSPQYLMEQVVLWDVELSLGGGDEFMPVVRRGEAYEQDEAGQLRLVRHVPLPPTPGEGTSIGLYERQIDHRYLFGIADVPPLPEGGTLEIELLPQQMTPILRVLNHDGQVIQRDHELGDWESDRAVIADLQALAEDHELREYFEHDAEYLPARGHKHFECSPLIRRLRVGDLVEWARDRDGAGPGRKIERYRGEIMRIRDRDPWDDVPEMKDFDIGRYDFLVSNGRGTMRWLRGRHGALRLAAKPGEDR